MDEYAALPLDPSDLDAASTLAVVESVLIQRRAAEVADLRLIAHWAALHGAPDDPDCRGGGRLVDVGGEGTPKVQDLAIGELAIVRGVHPMTCQSAMADVLDLQHRLPLTWALVDSLQAEVWVARRVAAMTRRLPRDRVELVDAAAARAIVGEAPSRVFTLVEAKIIEADPDAHAAKVEAELRRRYVALGRCDETGLRHVIARIEAADATWLDAMVDRVAAILAPRFPDDHTPDMLRSEAFTWLARPAELLALLIEAGQDREPDPQEPDPLAESRTTALPTDVLAALKAMDPTKLRTPGVVYVHVHKDTLEGNCPGVARMEQAAAVLPGHLAEVLGRAAITVKPVIDLNQPVSVNAYEHPEALKERVWLTTPGDYFPHAAGLSRTVDFDHPTPYKRQGPAGQTGTHNSGPLSRRHHRIKTHARYQARQTGPGEYVWRTPHGHYRLVDHRGTHRLAPDVGERLLTGSSVSAPA